MKESEYILKLWREVTPVGKELNKGYSVEIVKQLASVFAAGPFYYYIFNYFDLEIDFVHPNVKEILGIATEDFSIEKYLESIHPEDISQTQLKEMQAIRFLSKFIPAEKVLHYKISYLNRVATEKGTYKSILHQSIPLTVTEEHKIGYAMVIHTDISRLNVPLDNKISFIGLNGEPSWFCLDPENPDFSKGNFARLFSKRELEILFLLSEGKDSPQIAGQLHISPATVRTHRKNILFKSSCRNTTELIAKCIREGLI